MTPYIFIYIINYNQVLIMLLNQKGIALLAIMGMAASCANEEEFIIPGTQDIEATIEIEEDDDSRVSVDPSTLDGALAYYWNPSDEIGVFTNGSENNVRYVNTNQEGNVSTATFQPADGIQVEGTPVCAYYPYNATSGTSYSSLTGNIPQEQVINANMDNIPGLYRYGTHQSTNSSVSSFTFKNMFSTVRFKLDATGTELEGENLKGMDIVVTRSGSEVAVCGDFTFNARYGTYSRSSNVHNSMNIKFEGEPVFDGKIIFLTSMFPNVRKNDVMSITLHTTNYTATFDVTSNSYYRKNYTYNYTVDLASVSTLILTPNESTDDGSEETPEEDTETDGEETTTNTFTCATYNVDGLPAKVSFFSINSDGPGTSGTKAISQKIASKGWDFVGFSEDFAYHTELTSAMSDYTFGTYRGSVGSSALYSTINTDGLGFAAKSGVNFVENAIVAFDESYGGLTSGANTCIKKGFRHYVVTVAEGVEVDVYITHMNTYSSSGSGHIDAQHAQLTQIAEYINAQRSNNRPVIIMGDTNCRYTRHDFQTYFWSVLDSDLVVNDPWVDYQWAGVYPTYPSNSLMVSDATGTSDTDIICENTQKGEVVDKIIYINNPNASVQIKANSYLRDYDNFNGLADHMPIVVEFSYEFKTEGQSKANYDVTLDNQGNLISSN